MAKRLKLFIPLVLFFILMAVFVHTLTKEDYNPRDLPSALLNKSVPAFYLEALETDKQKLSPEMLGDKPYLLNVWATWCVSCRVEHPFFMQLQNQGVRIIGVNYKDERGKALQWLNQLGNPYWLNIYDEDGKLGLDLGVYGAPETYLVDSKGIIRYRHAGVLDEQVWQKQLQPIYQKLLEK